MCNFAASYGFGCAANLFVESEALCFDLVVRNLRNFETITREKMTMVHAIWRGLIASTSFIVGFLRTKYQGCRANSSTLLHIYNKV